MQNKHGLLQQSMMSAAGAASTVDIIFEGRLAEWPIALVLKTSGLARGPWVRILHLPPQHIIYTQRTRMNTITSSVIKKRQQELVDIKIKLKQELFGIDHIIDRVVDSIQSWYTFPSVVSSPVIINLWGMTGTGKTKLVRTLTKLLGFKDRYVEVQMDGGNSGFYDKAIFDLLRTSGIDEGTPGVLLLDEFQRYRTVDEQGKDVKQEKYADVWTLLSDGRLSPTRNYYSKILSELWDLDYHASYRMFDVRGNQLSKEEEHEQQSKAAAVSENKYTYVNTKYQMGVARGQELKREYRLKYPIQEIMTWDKPRLKQELESLLAEAETLEIDYSKLLIFICGNLDEAFTSSSNTNDCDTDADIYYNHTNKVTINKIKDVLNARFKPEQIARFGNNHVIYPSLPKKAYQQIIKHTCDVHLDKLYKQTGIKFVPNDSLYEEVYVNGVYPTQGTRPVFSTIHQIFSVSLTDLVVWAIEHEKQEMIIGIDSQQFLLHGIVDGKIRKSVPIYLDVRQQKQRNTEDFNTLVAVHEAGHAIVYAALLGYTPREVKVNLASFEGGYNIFPEQLKTRQNILDYIAVGLGGLVAEEFVFGSRDRTTGSEKDITQVSALAAKYVKLWGCDGVVGAVRNIMSTEWAIVDNGQVNDIVEEIMKRQKQCALDVIGQYRELLVELTSKLLVQELITPEEFYVIAKPYMNELKVSTDTIIRPYKEKWLAFKGS